jgi:glycosyltransferase involved in cell wall biosynthesis
MDKILLVTNNFPPVIDGVGDYTFNLMNELKNHETVFVICHDLKCIKDLNKKNGTNNFVYPIIKKWNFFAFSKIISFLKHNSIKNIIIQYVPYSYSKLGLPIYMIFFPLLFRFNGIKCSFFFHEVSVRIIGYGFKNFILGVLQRTIAYLICLFSNIVFTNSIFGGKLLYPFKSVYIPIPSNIILDKTNNNLCLDLNNILIISFLNRCNFELLEVISMLSKTEYDGIKLYCIGHSSDLHKKNIQNKINSLLLNNNVSIILDSDSVVLADYISKATIYIQLENVYRTNDGGVCTKSGTIMAAMSAGVPIVSTKGDMTDLNFFRNNENILFVEGNNISAIHDSLLYLIENHEIAKNLGKNAYLAYINNASWEVHRKKILNCF